MVPFFFLRTMKTWPGISEIFELIGAFSELDTRLRGYDMQTNLDARLRRHDMLKGLDVRRSLSPRRRGRSLPPTNVGV